MTDHEFDHDPIRRRPQNAPVGDAGNESTRATLNELSRTAVELVRIVMVRKWLLFVPFCLATTGAFVLSLYVPRRYVASTLFERRDDPVLVNLPRNDGAGAFRAFRQRLVQDVTNPEEVFKVVETLDLVDRYPLPQETLRLAGDKADSREWRARRIAAKIAAGLQVTFHQQTTHLDTIELTFTTDQPDFMAEILDGVREHYVHVTQQRITTLLEQTKDWFEEEVDKRMKFVDALEDDLIQFKAEHEGLDPLNPTASIVQLSSLRNDLLDLQRQRRSLETQIMERKRFLQDKNQAGPVILPGGLMQSIRIDRPEQSAESRRLAGDIAQLDRQITELKITRGMTDKHPDVVALATKKELIEDDLARSQTSQIGAVSVNGMPINLKDQPDPLVADTTQPQTQAGLELRILEKLLEDHAIEEERVRDEVATFEGLQLNALNHRKEFRAREAEVNRAREELVLHQGYADLVGRVLTAENSQRGILFEKIKPSTGSSVPTSPRMATVFLLAMISGAVTGIVMVLLAELFDRTIRTRDQIARVMNLPVLESIDEIVTAAVRRKRFVTQRILAPIASIGCVVIVILAGGVAYLSLNNRDLYQRAIHAPRSVFISLINQWDRDTTVSQAQPVGTETNG